MLCRNDLINPHSSPARWVGEKNCNNHVINENSGIFSQFHINEKEKWCLLTLSVVVVYATLLTEISFVLKSLKSLSNILILKIHLHFTKFIVFNGFYIEREYLNRHYKNPITGTDVEKEEDLKLYSLTPCKQQSTKTKCK